MRPCIESYMTSEASQGNTKQVWRDVAYGVTQQAQQGRGGGGGGGGGGGVRNDLLGLLLQSKELQ